MLTLGTFGAGYLMRPAGRGRAGRLHGPARPARGADPDLVLDGGGHVVIACTPAYRTIGMVAPIVVVLGRCCRDFRRESSGRRVRVPGGDRHAGASRILLRVAIGEPAGRGVFAALLGVG